LANNRRRGLWQWENIEFVVSKILPSFSSDWGKENTQIRKGRRVGKKSRGLNSSPQKGGTLISNGKSPTVYGPNSVRQRGAETLKLELEGEIWIKIRHNGGEGERLVPNNSDGESGEVKT